MAFILTQENKSSTDLLLSLREQAGVHSDNPYFLSLNNDYNSHIHGNKTLTKLTGSS